LIPRKGLHVLLKALALLPAHSWRLTIAGDPTPDPAYTARVRRLARLVQRSGRIRFAGALSPRQVAAELSQAQVLAVPSSHEGFGIAYLEGMAFGLPALASAHGGAAELVRDGYNGFLIQPGEVTSLAERLDLLRRNRERLGRMGTAARRTFLQRPTWRTSVRSCVRWMRRLARG
jgi:glycosyltransferase involved in cell wall biosynthesis